MNGKPFGVPKPVTLSHPGPVVSNESVPKTKTSQRVEEELRKICDIEVGKRIVRGKQWDNVKLPFLSANAAKPLPSKASPISWLRNSEAITTLTSDHEVICGLA